VRGDAAKARHRRTAGHSRAVSPWGISHVLNPTLLIEVLSPSTESYDRGEKFEHYRRVESLVEYVLVAQDEPRVESFVQRPGQALALHRHRRPRGRRDPLPPSTAGWSWRRT